MFNFNIDLVIDVFLDKGNTKFTNNFNVHKNSEIYNLKVHRPYTKVEKNATCNLQYGRRSWL